MSIKKFLSLTVLISSLLCISSLPLWADASPTPSNKTIPREEKIGRRVAASVEKEYPRVTDPAKEAKLNVILGKLTPYLERQLKYNVKIIELKDPNAFALPGGQIYITTGMLSFLKSDDELAAIFSHELIHADRAHGIVQASRNQKLSVLTLAGIIAAAGGVPGAAIIGSAIQTAAINSYSIDLEKEADAKGIDVMTKAGYNPAAMLTMMERLAVHRLKSPHRDPGIFQTHPEVEDRIKAAVAYMKSKNINIQRKEVLGRLKVNVKATSGDVALSIDSTKILTLPDGPKENEFMRIFKKRLDHMLELELAPYDIQVVGSAETSRLVIRGKVLLKDDEKPFHSPNLGEIRDKIVDAITKARRGNPLADYYQ